MWKHWARKGRGDVALTGYTKPGFRPSLRCRPTNAWPLSEVNKDFSLCPSYPRAVIMPRTVDNDALARSARFLQGGCFPVLSYYHTPSRTVSPTPPQILSLAPTASLLGPFLHWAGQFGAQLLPWLLPFLAAPCPASNRPSPLSLILPLPTLAPPLSRVLESRLSSPDPGRSGRLKPSLFVNPGPSHVLLIGSVPLPAKSHPEPAPSSSRKSPASPAHPCQL